MDGIPVGTVQGKVWGWTQRVFRNETVQVDRAFVRRGMRCSLHLHRHRSNTFFVESGRLLVRVHKDGLVDEVTLSPGQQTTVRPGDKHEMEALDDAHVLEVYSVALGGEDIVRDNQGGQAVQPQLRVVG